MLDNTKEKELGQAPSFEEAQFITRGIDGLNGEEEYLALKAKGVKHE